MYIVTTSDLKANISRYLTLVKDEDIIITKNGKKIARIIREEDDLVGIAKSLFGILPPDISTDEIKREKIKLADNRGINGYRHIKKTYQ